MSHSHKNEFITATGVRWDDPEEGKTWLVSLISITTLAALVIFLSVVYFQADINYVNKEVVEESYIALQKRVADQKEELSRGGPYIVQVGGKDVQRLRMPIADAMKAVVADPKLAVPPPAPPTAAPAAPAAPAKRADAQESKD